MQDKIRKERVAPPRRMFPPRPVLIIFAVSMAVYLNTLSNGFVFDDSDLILNNYWIREIKSIPEIFTTNFLGFSSAGPMNYYRPMIHLAYMAEYHIFGLNPFGFHLFNMLFHAGVSVLVYLLATMLVAGNGRDRSSTSTSIPFVASLLFSVNPIHTEAVSWVAGFQEISFTFFYLLSLYFYIKAADEGRRFALALSTGAFLVSILCKETALTLPLVILCYEYLYRKPESRSSNQIRRFLPFLLAVVFYLLARIIALKGFAPVRQHTEFTAYGYFINVFPLFMKYIRMLLFPIDLNAFHVLHPISSLSGGLGVFSVAATVVFAALCYLAFTKDKGVSFCLFMIAIPLLPVLYMPGLGKAAFAERYLYLPSLGFAMLSAIVISRLQKKPGYAMAAGMVTVLIVGLYCAGTISRNTVWKDSFALWTDTVQKSPDGAIPHDNMGTVYYAKGLLDNAVEEYRTALRLDPYLAEAHDNLGSAYFDKGLTDLAVEEYGIALKINPRNAEANYNLGMAYSSKGLADKAVERYLAALESNPYLADAHNNLGNIYLSSGMVDRAVKEYEAAIKLNPNLAEAHYNLGVACLKKGMVDKALEEYQAALRLKHSLSDAPGEKLFRHVLSPVQRQK